MSFIAPRRLILTASAGALVALFTVSSSAHHSTAMFNWGPGNEKTMKGAVVERWDWTNPHTFLYVTAGGEHWAFEGMSPNHLGRIGWDKRTLKAGDKIDLTYYPLKDGRKGGFNVTVTFADGKTMKQLESPSTNPANDR